MHYGILSELGVLGLYKLSNKIQVEKNELYYMIFFIGEIFDI